MIWKGNTSKYYIYYIKGIYYISELSSTNNKSETGKSLEIPLPPKYIFDINNYFKNININSTNYKNQLIVFFRNNNLIHYFTIFLKKN